MKRGFSLRFPQAGHFAWWIVRCLHYRCWTRQVVVLSNMCYRGCNMNSHNLTSSWPMILKTLDVIHNPWESPKKQIGMVHWCSPTLMTVLQVKIGKQVSRNPWLESRFPLFFWHFLKPFSNHRYSPPVNRDRFAKLTMKVDHVPLGFPWLFSTCPDSVCMLGACWLPMFFVHIVSFACWMVTLFRILCSINLNMLLAIIN